MYRKISGSLCSLPFLWDLTSSETDIRSQGNLPDWIQLDKASGSANTS
jgi:hypothetical protein